MYQYIENSNSVKRLSDNAFIPASGKNRDYRAYLKWLSEGNKPLPADPVPVPVPVVTMRQARLALFQAGLLSSVDAAIAALPEAESAVAQIEWEYATEVQRDYPWVIALGAQLGLTETQIDELFEAARTL
jgi:hypothetical protein